MTQSEEEEIKTVTLNYIMGLDKKKDGVGTMQLNPLHKDADKIPVGNIPIMMQRIQRIFTSESDANRKAVISWIQNNSLKNLDQIKYQDKSTLLHWAVRNGAEDLAVALAGTYPEMVNIADVNGKTPLHAALFNSSEIYDKIIKKLRTTEKGKEAIHKNDTCKAIVSISLKDMVEEALTKAFDRADLSGEENKTYLDSILSETHLPDLFVQLDNEGSLNIIDFVSELNKIIYDHHRDFKGEGQDKLRFFHKTQASKDKLCRLDPAYEAVKKAIKEYNKDKTIKSKNKPEVTPKEMDRQIGKILKVLRNEGMDTDMIKESQAMLTRRLIDKAHKKSTLKGGGFTIEAKDLVPYAKALVAAKEAQRAAKKQEELLKLASTHTVNKKGANLRFE